MTAIPAALKAYVDRIGAEELNFRRFMIRQYRGAYYTERVLIRVAEDGEVHCSDKRYAPTKEEATMIKGAVMGANFPRAVKVSLRKAREVERLGTAGSLWYYLVDRADGQVLMVQERATVDNQKVFVPWTHFSDGEWRRMEPDGALPFWKPEKRRGKARIMVHEGAKAARAADEVAQDKASSHPWAEEMRSYEHWGLIGGALAPHRADYEELRREAPVEVVYVCDNDFPGKTVLQEFSRHYGGSMKGIMLDERWPQAWDMADEMPPGMFSEGKFRGPRLGSLMKPATWATEQVQSGEKGRPAVILTRTFREEWVHSVVPEAYIHVGHPSRVYNASEFNNAIRPFSHVDDTARLVKGDEATKSVLLKYDPGATPGIYVDESGERYVNTHVPTPIDPEDGDASPWTDFMELLVPDRGDRLELMRWCATLVARPRVRMNYGVLLISETQGVGKGTLGEKILAPLVGMPNVSFPGESDIVDSNYNYWLSHKRLAVVHEIYAGHSSKAYNKLKSVITDRYVTVSRKYMANYEVENWVHIVACSNSRRAIQLSMDDRRWFVPTVTEDKERPGYWTRLNRWLVEGGGLGIIRRWAEEFLEENEEVSPGASAPWSAGKREVVEEGYSPGMELVSSFLTRVRDEMNGEHVVVVDTDLVRLIRLVIHEGRDRDNLERPLTIRKVARGAGWHIGTHPIPVALRWGDGRPSQKSRMVLSHQEDAGRRPEELAAAGMKPLRVEKLATDWGFREM